MTPLARPALFALLVFTACQAPPAQEPRAPEPLPAAPALPTAPALPADWLEEPPAAFEERVLAWPGGTTRLADAELTRLAEALRGAPEGAVRAATVLGVSGDARAAEVLLARLEARVLGPDRHSDAGDAVGAFALSRFAPRPAWLERLAALVEAGDPHPDLEVRTECAATLVAWGSDRGVPFLLSVLRIGTERAREEGLFWPTPPTTAWARGRAATVLAQRAGVETTVSTEASAAERQRQSDILEALILGPRDE